MRKLLVTSIIIILICVCIIIGVTFALFTDTAKVTNHLKAGSLDVDLIRTNLTYTILNEKGELDTVTDDTEVDFSGYTTENVFGIDSSDVVIVPGSFFDAELAIRNKGSIAFTYSVELKLSGLSNALAEQLEVTVTMSDGTVITKMLSELADGIPIASGSSKLDESETKFSIKVAFVDDVVVNENADESSAIDNDLAQSQTAAFDIIVTAVQATDPTDKP